MSQITIGGTTLNFKDSSFTGDQWEQVASWVLNGGAEGIDANAQIATEKAAEASASAAAARNSATSAGESAAAAASSATEAESNATAAEAKADAAAGSAANSAASATSAGESASSASEKASDAANSASAAATSAQTAQSAASTATDAAGTAGTAAEAASGSASKAQASAAAAAESAASVDGINKTAQSWAVGGTGTREGEDTNNAKYWAEQAQRSIIKGSVTLTVAGWVADGDDWKQTVTIAGGAAGKQVDLEADKTAIKQMLEDGTSALYIANENGTFTAHAVGEKPTAALTLQTTMYDVKGAV